MANKLDGGLPDMWTCFHMVPSQNCDEVKEKERRRMVNTLETLPDMDMMALVGSI